MNAKLKRSMFESEPEKYSININLPNSRNIYDKKDGKRYPNQTYKLTG